MPWFGQPGDPSRFFSGIESGVRIGATLSNLAERKRTADMEAQRFEMEKQQFPVALRAQELANQQSALQLTEMEYLVNSREAVNQYLLAGYGILNDKIAGSPEASVILGNVLSTYPGIASHPQVVAMNQELTTAANFVQTTALKQAEIQMQAEYNRARAGGRLVEDPADVRSAEWYSEQKRIVSDLTMPEAERATAQRNIDAFDRTPRGERWNFVEQQLIRADADDLKSLNELIRNLESKRILSDTEKAQLETFKTSRDNLRKKLEELSMRDAPAAPAAPRAPMIPAQQIPAAPAPVLPPRTQGSLQNLGGGTFRYTR